jgi:hypothetical protein
MFGALPCSSSGGLRRNCIYVNKYFVHQVGNQPRLYYDARSTNHQPKTLFVSVFRLGSAAVFCVSVSGGGGGGG